MTMLTMCSLVTDYDYVDDAQLSDWLWLLWLWIQFRPTHTAFVRRVCNNLDSRCQDKHKQTTGAWWPMLDMQEQGRRISAICSCRVPWLAGLRHAGGGCTLGNVILQVICLKLFFCNRGLAIFLHSTRSCFMFIFWAIFSNKLLLLATFSDKLLLQVTFSDMLLLQAKFSDKLLLQATFSDKFLLKATFSDMLLLQATFSDKFFCSKQHFLTSFCS